MRDRQTLTTDGRTILALSQPDNRLNSRSDRQTDRPTDRQIDRQTVRTVSKLSQVQFSGVIVSGERRRV